MTLEAGTLIADKYRIERLLGEGGELPPVSILIPARNEEVVIERTLEAVRQLRYPGGPLEIIVVAVGVPMILMVWPL